MSRYHIKDNGEPGVCNAAPGKCPKGDSAEHFDNKEEALHYSLEKLKEDNETFATLKSPKAGKTMIPNTYTPAPRYYNDRVPYSDLNLEEALQSAQDYARQGWFVVMEEWHEETRDATAVEEVQEALYDEENDYDEYYEIYNDALDELEYADPEKVEVFYSVSIFHNRQEFETFVDAFPDYFQGSNNAIVSLNKSEEFDGYDSEFDQDRLNLWRGWHASVKVFFEPEADKDAPLDATRFEGKRYDSMSTDTRIFFYGVLKSSFMKSDQKDAKILCATSASKILRAELREAPHPKVEAVVSAFEADATLENAERIFHLSL